MFLFFSAIFVSKCGVLFSKYLPKDGVVQVTSRTDKIPRDHFPPKINPTKAITDYDHSQVLNQ